MSASPALTITEGALKKRIGRKLAQQGEALRTSRSLQNRINCGDHYVVDISMNAIVHKFINLEETGKELGCIPDGVSIIWDEAG